MKLKQKIDTMSKFTGLDKYNRNTHPSARQLGYTKLEKDGFNYKTGLNEEAPYIREISDVKIRKAIQDEVKAKRLDYEKRSGLDLSPTSTYWESLPLEYALPNEEFVYLDEQNVLDLIKISAMLASGYVAPSLEESYSEKYLSARVYVSTEKDDTNKKFKLEELKQRAASSIFDVKDNQEKMLYLCRALSISVNAQMNSQVLFLLLVTHKDSIKTVEGFESLNYVLSMDNAALQIQQVVIEALKRKIIFNSEGFFNWGGTRWGTNQKEVIESFRDQEKSFIVLKSEVEARQ